MQLAAPRQAGPLDLGVVVLLHGAALAAFLFARVEPVSVRPSAPIVGQIVQAAPAAATPTFVRAPPRLAPLAMRTPPRRPPPPRAARKAAPLTSVTPRPARAVTPAPPPRVERGQPPSPPRERTPEPSPTRPPPTPVATAPAAPVRTSPPARASTAGSTASTAATAPAAAPTPRSGRPASGDANRAYFAALLQQLNRFKVYPPALRKAKVEGRVVLQFTIDAQGRVTASSVKRSSGHDALDAAASRMLTRASPLPAIPGSMGKSKLTLAVPIEYSLLMDR